jgi:MFS family permease
MPFYVIFVQLPQRFQSVNFTTAERAGILLLPCTLVAPIGALAAGIATKKIATEYVYIAGTAVICLGTGLLGSFPTGTHLWAGTYGYEIIVGIGLGLASPPGYMLLSTSVAQKDTSVGTGALNMMRTLGGCVAVAICAALHREYTSDRLKLYLSPEQIAAVQTSGVALARLPEAAKSNVAGVFGESYNRQFLIMTAFTGFNVLMAILLAIVRKRAGIFGMLELQKENEFRRAVEKTMDEENMPANREKNEVAGGQASTSNSSDEVLAIAVEHEKAKV